MRLFLISVLLLILPGGSFSGEPPVSLPSPAELVELLNTRYDKINNYCYIMESSEKAGRKISNRTIEFHFARPDRIYMKILKGKNKGSRVWYSSDTVKASGSGLLGKFKMKFKPDNKMVLSSRGSRVDESGWAHSLKTINKLIEQGWDTTVTAMNMESREAWLLKISSPANAPSSWYEYHLDSKEHLIVGVKYYEESVPVSEAIISSITINSEINPAIYE